MCKASLSYPSCRAADSRLSGARERYERRFSMSNRDPSLRRNAPRLALHVPEPPFRPGDTPDLSSLEIPAAGSAPRPDTGASASDTHALTTGLIRVLGDDDKAV